jgi:hypothetical protein
MKLLVCALALVACNKGLENKRVDKLDFKSFTIAVPAGWNEVTDARLTGKMAAGAHVLMPVKPPGGFMPSIYIQELEMSPADHQQIMGASADFCRDSVQKPIAAQAKTEAGKVATADFKGFKGCDWEMIDPSSAQAARQLSLSNGKVGVSVTCNRDKKGAPDIDGICVAVVNGLTLK